MIPHSSISSFLVSSPTPLTVATPARAGSSGGATTVTPVGSPLAAWEWPTHTPGTSVMALRGPVASRPTGPARSLQRGGMNARFYHGSPAPRRPIRGRRDSGTSRRHISATRLTPRPPRSPARRELPERAQARDRAAAGPVSRTAPSAVGFRYAVCTGACEGRDSEIAWLSENRFQGSEPDSHPDEGSAPDRDRALPAIHSSG